MSGITAITMPKFGLSMTEGKIVGWSKREGDEVNVGDDLVDIETTKITNAFESPVKGVLRRHIAKRDEDLPVGALIAVVADAKTADAEIDEFVARFQAEFSVDQDNSGAPAAPEPKTIETNGQRIRYLELGSGEGAPVVFIHGFGGDLNNWLFTQPALAARHRTLAIDLPGHGGSSKDAPATIAELAAAVSNTLAELSVTRAHLVGHSLGAAIALQMGLTNPAQVASLTLIAPAGLGETIDGDFIDGMVEADRRKTLEPVLQKLFVNKSLVSRDMIEEFIKFKRLDGAKAALSAIAAANFRDAKQSVIFLPRLGELPMPVQIIAGAKDEILAPPDVAYLPTEIAFHSLEASGHMPHMERAAEVNALIEDFVDRAA